MASASSSSTSQRQPTASHNGRLHATARPALVSTSSGSSWISKRNPALTLSPYFPVQVPPIPAATDVDALSDTDDDPVVTVVVTTTPKRRRHAQSSGVDTTVTTNVRAAASTDSQPDAITTTFSPDNQSINSHAKRQRAVSAPALAADDVVAKRPVPRPRPPALKPLVRRNSIVPVAAVNTVIDLTNPLSSALLDNVVHDFPSYTNSPPPLTAAKAAEYAVYEQLALTQYAALEPVWHKQLESLRRAASPSRSGNSQLRDIQFTVFGKLPKATCSRVGYRFQATELPDVLTAQQQQADDEVLRSLAIDGFPHLLTAKDMLLLPSFPFPIGFVPRKRQKVQHAANAASAEPVEVKKIGRMPTNLLSETAIRAEMNRLRETEGAQAATRSRAVRNLRDRQEDVVVAPVDEKRASRRSTQMSSVASKQVPSPRRPLRSPVKAELPGSNGDTRAPQPRFVTDLDDLLNVTPKKRDNDTFTFDVPASKQTASTHAHTPHAVKQQPFTPILAKLSRRPSLTSDTMAAAAPSVTAPPPRPITVPPLPGPALFANLHRNHDDMPHRLQEYLRSYIVSVQSSVKPRDPT